MEAEETIINDGDIKRIKKESKEKERNNNTYDDKSGKFFY